MTFCTVTTFTACELLVTSTEHLLLLWTGGAVLLFSDGVSKYSTVDLRISRTRSVTLRYQRYRLLSYSTERSKTLILHNTHPRRYSTSNSPSIIVRWLVRVRTYE